jgi:hypothetical protein
MRARQQRFHQGPRGAGASPPAARGGTTTPGTRTDQQTTGRHPGGLTSNIPLAIQPGREGQIAGVDRHLMADIAAGARHLPAGYKVVAFSGYSPTHGNAGSAHRRGLAVDVKIYDDKGIEIPDEGADRTGMYRRLAQGTYGEMLVNDPSLAKRLSWGGSFGTTQGSGVPDLMHFDIMKAGRRSPGSQFAPPIQEIGPQSRNDRPRHYAAIGRHPAHTQRHEEIEIINYAGFPISVG